jgi:hypothetical protein
VNDRHASISLALFPADHLNALQADRLGRVDLQHYVTKTCARDSGFSVNCESEFEPCSGVTADDE